MGVSGRWVEKRGAKNDRIERINDPFLEGGRWREEGGRRMVEGGFLFGIE